MVKSHRLLVLAFLLPLIPPAVGNDSWLPQIDGLPYDPVISAGRLDSGFRFLHAETTDKNRRISLRLIVQAGSNDEQDDELGFAHFVEHMAFNGTRAFPADTIRATLARAGVRVGPEVNAFTSPSHTVYQLDLPNDDPANFDLALRVMRDWCDGLKFEDREVKREAKVILAEINARGIVAGPFTQERMGFVYPDHPLGERHPLGTPHSVDRARSAGVRGFYERWYRPANIILAVVADLPHAQVESAIRQHFESFTARGPEPARTPRPPAVNPSSPQLHWTQIGPIKSFNFEIIHTRPEAPTDSVEAFRRQLATQLAIEVIQSRLNRLVLLAPAEVEGIKIYEAHPAPGVAELTLGIGGQPEHWKTLLQTLLREYLTLRKYGLTPAEFEEARNLLLHRIDYEAHHPSHDDVPAYAARLTQALMYHRVLPADATRHQIAREFLPTVTPESCLTELADYLRQGQARYFIYGDLGEAGQSKDLVQALQEGSRGELPPPAAETGNDFPYDTFGPPAELVAESTDAGSGVRQVTYANGVHFNFKPTAFSPDNVSFLVRLQSGGRLLTPADATALPDVAQAALIAGGLQQADVAAITRAFQGRQISLNFRIEEDSLVFSGTVEREKLPLMCRVIAAYLTDPAISATAVASARTLAASQARRAFHQAETTLSANLHYALSQEDPRFKAYDHEAPAHITVDDVRAWLLPQLSASTIEVNLVGDVTAELAQQAVDATFGALPRSEPLPSTTPIQWLQEDDKFYADSFSQRAGTTVLWPIPVDGSVRARREIELLAKCFNERIVERLREEKGLTYSPQLGTLFPDSNPHLAYLQVTVITQLRYVERAAREIRKVADALAARGVDEDLRLQALNPTLNSLDAQLRDNDYWLHSVLDRLSTNPEQLHFADSRRHDLEAISAARLSEIAAGFLNKKQAIEIYAGTGEKGKSMFR